MRDGTSTPLGFCSWLTGLIIRRSGSGFTALFNPGVSFGLERPESLRFVASPDSRAASALGSVALGRLHRLALACRHPLPRRDLRDGVRLPRQRLLLPGDQADFHGNE